jgi:hypothetical protein
LIHICLWISLFPICQSCKIFVSALQQSIVIKSCWRRSHLLFVSFRLLSITCKVDIPFFLFPNVILYVSGDIIGDTGCLSWISKIVQVSAQILGSSHAMKKQKKDEELVGWQYGSVFLRWKVIHPSFINLLLFWVAIKWLLFCCKMQLDVSILFVCKMIATWLLLSFMVLCVK